MLPKMKRYVKTFKVKGGDKNHKLMSFHIDDDKLSENRKRFRLRLKT